MSGVFIFILGMMAGGLIGVTFICCLQINRINDYEERIQKLQKKEKE